MTTLPSSRPDETHIGGYRLLAPIGEGGMGVVHLAQGEDGRRVALKVLRPHIVGDTEARERLAREVSSLRRITSPRIAEILDADPHGPVPFVVTRYVPGLSLYHHVAEEGPVTGADLLHFADALAEAVLAVHSVGVLHRDIKPTNVLMEGRSPVLIDFGLARVAEDPRLTQTGWLLGTPGYLAPEILYGDDATVASDVHAWAATVVFAATGRPPYGRGPAMAIMDRVRRGEHDLSAVPQPLDRILREALSPEPLERPSVHELRAWLSDLRRRSHLDQPIPEAEPAPRVKPEAELWTLPYAPQVVGTASKDPTVVTDQPTAVADPTPAAAAQPLPPTGRDVPVHEAAPYQQSAPPTRVLPLPPVSRPVAPPVAAPVNLPVNQPVNRPFGPPANQQAGPTARPDPVFRALPVPPQQEHRGLRLLQLLGLGAVTSAVVGYAPYAGTALVALLVLVLRTASVARQRHGRRRMLRGRTRWYDVPATTLSLPVYLLLAFLGSVLVVGAACFTAVALFSVGYLAGQPVEIELLLAGLGFTPALWWGPGSGRVREMTRTLVGRSARSEFGGWLVVGLCVLATAILLGALLGGGPSWAPAVSAPWS